MNAPLPDPFAAVNGARTEAPQDQAQDAPASKPKSKVRLNREAASLAFWRAVVDASRAKGNL